MANTIIYQVPSIPTLLAISSFLYLLNVSTMVFTNLIHAGLLGPLLIGIIFGPQAANLLPASLQSTFASLGYIGLLLLIFDAGLSTDPALLLASISLSAAVALTGVLLPIALSLLLLHLAFGYSALQAFAAGAALCSTSLGTTLALLDVETRATRAGSVLMSAALLDDIAGLVIAGIISQLTSNDITQSGSGKVPWHIVVRPVLVSLGFAFGTPVLAYVFQRLVRVLPVRRAFAGPGLLLVLVVTLEAFVAASGYAGTSELFGAYLAGAFLTHVFRAPALPHQTPPAPPRNPSPTLITPHAAFNTYLLPPLQTLLAPLFFASIGAALPMRALGAVGGSHAVVWRGVVYAAVMVLAKAAVGLWMLVWPEGGKGKREGNEGKVVLGDIEVVNPSSDSRDITAIPPGARFSGPRSALLVGLAMVARGEIALIVAQLARTLLVGPSSANQDISEPYVVVIWAILVTTVVGAVGVGWLLRGNH